MVEFCCQETPESAETTSSGEAGVTVEVIVWNPLHIVWGVGLDAAVTVCSLCTSGFLLLPLDGEFAWTGFAIQTLLLTVSWHEGRQRFPCFFSHSSFLMSGVSSASSGSTKERWDTTIAEMCNRAPGLLGIAGIYPRILPPDTYFSDCNCLPW